VDRTRTCTGGGTDRGTFQPATRLMADDATRRRANQTAGDGSALGVGAGGIGTVAKSENAGGKQEVSRFHDWLMLN
jgi:hypothetical protein